MSTTNKEHLEFLKKDFWGTVYFEVKRRNLLTGTIGSEIWKPSAYYKAQGATYATPELKNKIPELCQQ